MAAPQIIVIAGPNGAGKSTSAPALLPAGVPFLNADVIAQQLEGATGNTEMEASRLLLAQWRTLAEGRQDFAIETTLASRSLAPRIRRLKEDAYQFRLVFLWLPSAELAIARVADRVRRGGHSIPEATIRRRYAKGLLNLQNLYLPIAESWAVIQNEESGQPRLIAEAADHQVTVYEHALWNALIQSRE